MELSAGTRVGPYEIQRAIGAGGMGVVYRALDGRLGRQVAIKVLPLEVRENPDRLRRFEQEARTIGGLNHPNLVTLHDVGTHDGVPYLVTELLDGHSLRARIADAPLALRDVVRIASEIARGLAAAHGAGVVHRDIKPDNVFVMADGRVKILDFGIAKLRRDEPSGDVGEAATAAPDATAATGTGVVIGTPGYMSPEQLAGTAVDARTDIFALGVVLYEMLCRKRPFAAATGVEESYAILKEPPPALPAHVPQSVAKIALRCLDKRPDGRFQSAADLAFALEALDDIAAGRISTPGVGVALGSTGEAFAATIVPGTKPPVAAGTGTGAMADTAAGTGTSGTAATAIGGVVTARNDQGPAASTGATTAASATAQTLVPTAAPRVSGATKLLAFACLALVAGCIALWMTRPRPVRPHRQAPVEAMSWPSLVKAGPIYTRVTYHSQSKWFARFAVNGNDVYFSRRKVEQPDLDKKPKGGDDMAQVAPKKRDKQDDAWEVMVTKLGDPLVRRADLEGRVLDVARDGTLALRHPLRGTKGGILARAKANGDSKEFADNVEDASWAPDSKTLAVIAADESGNTRLDYPVASTSEAQKRKTLYTPSHGGLGRVRMSPSGQRIAVIEQLAPPDPRGHVIMFDLAGKRLATSKDHNTLEGIAWSPDGQEAWFSTDGALWALTEGGDERELLRTYGRLQLLDVTSNGRILAAASDERMRMYQWPDPPRDEARDISYQDAGAVSSISRDGTRIAFVEATGLEETDDGYAAFVRTAPDASDASAGAKDDKPTPLGNAFAVAMMPDGKSALLLCGAGAPLRLYEFKGGATAVPTSGIVHFDFTDVPEIQGDGKYAVIRAAAEDSVMKLWLVDLTGNKAPAVLAGAPSPVKAGHHPISSDGTLVAVGDAHAIALIHLETSTVEKIKSEKSEEPLRFSDDGKALFVIDEHGWPRQVSRIDLKTKARTPVHAIQSADRPRQLNVAISGSGEVLVYSHTHESGDLFVLEPPPAPAP